MKYLILAGALVLAACAAPCPDEACQRQRDAAMAMFSASMTQLGTGLNTAGDAYEYTGCRWGGYYPCRGDAE